MNIQTELLNAIQQICAERNIEAEPVFVSLEKAISVAASKDYPGFEVRAEINRTSGEISAYLMKTVVKKVTDANMEIGLAEAKKLSGSAKEGDKIAQELHISSLGRIAANAAKFAIINAIRNAEKEAVLQYYTDMAGTIVSGKIQRVFRGTVYVELERGVGEMPEEEQIPNEFYELGQRYRFLLKSLINEENYKAILLSRSDPAFIEKLFAVEVPEIANKAVVIKGIARTPGIKTKIAVAAQQEGVDPIGACVGQKGIRIANIMTELREEKIDVIPWDDNLETYVANALRPAQVKKVTFHKKTKTAKIEVEDDQLSLAIGREGQNVKLASLLTGVEIDILNKDRIVVRDEPPAAPVVPASEALPTEAERKETQAEAPAQPKKKVTKQKKAKKEKEDEAAAEK